MISEQKFIHTTIAQWAVETELLLKMEVTKKRLILSGDLIRSIGYRIVKEAVGTRYDLSFNDYGRILDMNRQKVSARSLNRKVLLGGKEVRRRSGNTKWYAKNVYRQVYGNEGLFARLLDGYTDWALQQVISSLTNTLTVFGT